MRTLCGLLKAIANFTAETIRAAECNRKLEDQFS